MDNNDRDHRDLKEKIKKKITTTMIGALAEFEREFAYLWDENSPMVEQFSEKWGAVREAILDMGNDHIRRMGEELESYDVQRRRYNYQFNFRGKGN